MQSILALVGLVLVNLAAAGPCKPSGPTSASSLALTSSVSTDISETSEVPSLTVPQSTTTTQEVDIIITNAIEGGSFAARNANNPPSGLTNFGASGNAEFHEGGCYKVDGSPDDGCAALTASGNPAGKRDTGSFASIWQTLNSLSTGSQRKYTVQFYYLVASAGSQDCTVTAALGNKQFYSQSLSSVGTSVSWTHVLEQVDAESASATFAISMTCSGNGISVILVDSIFISNQVTPANIGNFVLDFGVPTTNPVTTSESLPTSTERTIEPETTSASSSSEVFTERTMPETTTTSPPNTDTTRPAQPTETACKPTCELRAGFDNTPEWNCRVYGLYSGLTYQLPNQDDDETRPWYDGAEDCAEICKTLPGCKSAGYMFAPRKCFFSNNVVTHSEVRNMMDDGVDVDWYGMDCFACSACEHGAAETTVAEVSSTPVNTDNTIAPEPTTFTTRTSDSPATTTSPADVCLYNRGQECEFNRFKDHSDTLCIWAAIFTGTTWKESREDYPYQDGPYQCAAICQTLKNCESSGYYSTENRCLFTSKKLQRSDMISHEDRPFDHSVWSHNSCWTCPTCSETAALPATRYCSYDQGDSCRAVSGKPGALCNYQGFWGAYNQWDLARFPDQSSPEKCAAICMALDYCVASGYKDDRCMFSFRELKVADFTDWPDHSRDGTWSDNSCFECPGCTA
ncbi:hypothetical protein FOXG_15778 [Fusarium oxysporum f. sp. lycopersici 4287]|uniref:Apple domain-containing protein n=3 Tax=Fusarium oxysporum TaxID=5507 RepID=A0A0J9W5J6_FUSO4|nr:hypothetical protein FOXG_15778 [Fusarium oxysporum f. sp. lycopersici 4287]EXK28166.1 hypothetical protein FOMG_15612 [Fusarium oxysporum f. sp. melonis 26406]KAJ9420048.1 hypothetical protein QL093DRAFT_2325205 [Fusarium oxysporum]KNB18148.1 hypothetical protein FOXG_15778 [Fusarium oxysporum f. sp. lycopersici 4287]